MTADNNAKHEARLRHRRAAKEAMRSFGTNAPALINARHILQLIIDSFDGPEGYAAELRAEYQEAKRGSTTRVRIFGFIDNLMQFCAKQYGNDDPFAGQTREELEKRLEQIVLGRLDQQLADVEATDAST